MIEILDKYIDTYDLRVYGITLLLLTYPVPFLIILKSSLFNIYVIIFVLLIYFILIFVLKNIISSLANKEQKLIFGNNLPTHSMLKSSNIQVPSLQRKEMYRIIKKYFNIDLNTIPPNEEDEYIDIIIKKIKTKLRGDNLNNNAKLIRENLIQYGLAKSIYGMKNIGIIINVITIIIESYFTYKSIKYSIYLIILNIISLLIILLIYDKENVKRTAQRYADSLIEYLICMDENSNICCTVPNE